jgi:N-carbamoylputrescine amidase
MRILTLKGADTVFVPTATTGLHSKAWEVEARANAIFNGIFIAQANKVGREGASDFFGRSIVVNPKGTIIAEASEIQEEVLLTEIDTSIITEIRKEWPFLRDRRPDTYKELTLL